MRIVLADLPADAPEWAKTMVEALNENADALEELQRERAKSAVFLKTITLTTLASAADTFAGGMKVALPFMPSTVAVVRVVNRTSPADVAVLSVAVDWARDPIGIIIKNIIGLLDSTAYTLTLECRP